MTAPALQPVEFRYKNHRGEVSWRRVEPQTITYFSRPGHDYQPGWFLTGVDLDKGKHRIFRLSHIVFDDRDPPAETRRAILLPLAPAFDGGCND